MYTGWLIAFSFPASGCLIAFSFPAFASPEDEMVN